MVEAELIEFLLGVTQGAHLIFGLSLLVWFALHSATISKCFISLQLMPVSLSYLNTALPLSSF